MQINKYESLTRITNENNDSNFIVGKSSLPIMNQDEFIAFWKIIYNLFTGMDNEAEMYHAAATVSTLLLKLGEVSRKFNSIEEVKTRASTNSNLDELKSNQVEESNFNNSSRGRSSTLVDSTVTDSKSWNITFEQLIASLLTDNLLVNYFDAKFSIDDKLAVYKSQHA